MAEKKHIFNLIKHYGWSMLCCVERVPSAHFTTSINDITTNFLEVTFLSMLHAAIDNYRSTVMLLTDHRYYLLRYRYTSFIVCVRAL